MIVLPLVQSILLEYRDPTCKGFIIHYSYSSLGRRDVGQHVWNVISRLALPSIKVS